MDLKVRRAAEILRNDGVGELSKKTQSKLYDTYTAWRGKRTIREGPISLRVTYETDRQRSLVKYFEQTERDTLRDILSELRPNDVFLDVGANQGIYTLFAESIVGDVIAVEPYPPNLPTLQQNIRLNEANIEILTVALSDKDGKIEFVNTGNEVNGSVGIAAGDEDTISVDTATADKLVRSGDIPQPTVVKIDVEGAESLVVDGMEETLRNKSCRVLYCEIHQDNWYGKSTEDYGKTADDIEADLSAIGFEITRLEEIKDQYVLKCVKSE